MASGKHRHWFWQALAWPCLAASFLILVMLFLQKLRAGYVLPGEAPTGVNLHPALPIVAVLLGLIGLLFLSAGKRHEAAATYAAPPLHNSRGRIWVGVAVILLLITFVLMKWLL